MNVTDLRAGPPPRWSDSVGGVLWLPRLAAKARAYDAGTLGEYLYGQSPVDDAFLRRSNLDYASFLEIVRGCDDDAGVLDEIERRSPGAEQRLRGWSERLPRKSGWLMYLFDLDEGHIRPWWRNGAAIVASAIYYPLVRLMRIIRPARTGSQGGAPR